MAPQAARILMPFKTLHSKNNLHSATSITQTLAKRPIRGNYNMAKVIYF